MRFLLTVLLIATSPQLIAKVIQADHIQVQVVRESNRLEGNVTLGVHYRMDPQWHIYWKNPGDSGAAPKFDLENGSIDAINWPYPKRIPVGPLTNYGYSNEVVILLDTQLQQNPKLNLEWLVCKVDCIPGFAKIELSPQNVSLQPGLIEEYRQKLPLTQHSWHAQFLGQNSRELRFALQGPNLDQIHNFFIFPKNGSQFQSKVPTIKLEDKSLEIAMPLTANANLPPNKPQEFTLVRQTSNSTESYILNLIPKIQIQDFLYGLFFAFLGGLLLNLMPCVFPVLVLKGYSFLKHQNQKAIKKSSWLYSLGIVTSFFILGGLLTTLRLSGAAIGWGFQLQSPVFISLMIVLFLLLALVFLDIFSFDNLNLPPKLQKYFSSDFGTGVLAVVVASPCTAPFMGAALGLTLFLPPLLSLFIFVALGIGLATPILLLAHWPQLTTRLPKAGPWMIRFKRWMALPLLLTAAWLIWILSLQLGAENVSEHWNNYDVVQIEEVRKLQPVFIDFTAAWCITCQVNKKTVLDTPEITKLFNKHNVYLVRADWTHHDEKITNALAQFERNSVPLYVFYSTMSNSAQVLPELLTKDDIRNLFRQGGSQ